MPARPPQETPQDPAPTPGPAPAPDPPDQVTPLPPTGESAASPAPEPGESAASPVPPMGESAATAAPPAGESAASPAPEPGESASPVPPTGESAATAESPAAPASPASSAAPSVGALVAESFVPNTLHLSSAGRWKAIALRVAVGVGLAVAGAVGVLVWQLATEPVVTRSGQETEDALDMEETPFTAGVDYDGTPPAAWKIVLDRPLTPAEQRRLAATVHPEDARDFLTSLGGRTLRYPAAFEGRSDLAQAYFGRDATVLHMDLFSKRKAPLTITWMEVVNLSCHAPTARTVVVFPPQGGADYEGVLFDLARPGAVPIITDEGSHQGQPYFGPRRIALGDGASPGGLRVEAVTQGRSCTWEIKAKYRDAYQHFGSLTLKDGTKPFSAEAAPSRPEQLWYMDASKPDGQQWVPCHVRPEEDTCREWRETRG